MKREKNKWFAFFHLIFIRKRWLAKSPHSSMKKTNKQKTNITSAHTHKHTHTHTNISNTKEYIHNTYSKFRATYCKVRGYQSF